MPPKKLYWVGSSKDDISGFPSEVKLEFGFGLHQAQLGGKSIDAVPLVGFGSAGVLELRANFQTDTYRAVYTVRFSDAVYVLHAFQKKSVRKAKTPKHEMEIIKRRLKVAEQQHKREIDDAREKHRVKKTER